MKIFYDTEFHERGRGKPINLLSIGAIDEINREFYRVVKDIRAVRRANKNKWMALNVIPYLPVRRNLFGRLVWDKLRFDYALVKPIEVIAQEWENFTTLITNKPELWAWYGAYDHVVMAQMFGRMIDLPKYVPTYTMDLKQRWFNEGQPDMPEQRIGEHHALDDARHNKVMSEYLDERRG